MNFKLAASALFLASAFAALQGCSADVPQDEADAEEAAATENDLTANGSKLVGAFHGEGSGIPSFDGLVFKADGTFFGDVDTGIRCFRAPCPSNVHLEGKFSATKSYLRLTPKSGDATGFYGRYKYALTGDKLTISNNMALAPGWSNTFDKALSYCAQPSDCGGQGLIHPMCVGGWTCGETKANSCGYKCGIVLPPANQIWPADATKLVANSPGGGFTPPPPAGSTCAIGHQKYSLDRDTRVLIFETCEYTDAATPLHLKTGTTTLTATELARVEAAMNGLKVSTQETCGADKPYLTVAVTTPEGSKTYTDSFYKCQGGSRTYVDGIDAVFGALRTASE
jgi:hypothetical protein